jgi:molecular chaperone GrpE
VDHKRVLNHYESIETFAANDALTFFEQKLIETAAQAEKSRLAQLEAEANLAYVRHRSQEEILNTHKFAIEGFARSLLAIKDDLETALSIETEDHRIYKHHIALVYGQLVAAFDAFDLCEINPEIGRPFDPSTHRLAVQVCNDRLERTVVEVRKKGYRIGDRLLRPALVAISGLTENPQSNPGYNNLASPMQGDRK